MSPLVTKLPWSSDQGYLNQESLVSVCLPKWGVYAPSAKLSPNAPSTSAVPPQQKARQSVDFMVEHLLAPRLSKAGSVAPRLKPFTAMKRAKRELNELLLFAGLGYWRT